MVPKEIILHHTASSRDKTKLRDIENWHKVRWPDFISSLGWHIGYHYVILGNGQVCQTRRDNEIGAHCIPNEGKIGIALTGNFEIEKPSQEQLNSLTNLLEKIKENYKLTDYNLFGHCEKSQTACPGKNFMEWLYLYRKVNWLKWQILKLKELLESLKGRQN